MPWNAADRAKYEVIRKRYSSDMSDAEFALIAPLLPAPKARGRKPTDLRSILNALFYLIRSGCPWRLLAKDFPPFTTVQNRFYAWRGSGLWSQTVAVLVRAARQAEGRAATPTAVVVDSQSVKTTEAGGPRGGACPWASQRLDPRDAAKKIKGRKRHLAVDTLGLPIACQMTTADVQDRDALAALLKDVHVKSLTVTMSFVDGGYQGEEAQRAAFEASRISITVVKRTDKHVKGFVVVPKRWVVERTLDGSTGHGGSQRTSRPAPNPPSHGSRLPSPASSSEGSVAPPSFQRKFRVRLLAEPVRVRDFVDPALGRASPYGVYDITDDKGWISVGAYRGVQSP